MPEYWTASRIADRIHRTVLAPAGFERRGRVCHRSDHGLRRTLTVHTNTRGRPTVEMLAQVAVSGLPSPVTSHRHDSLWGNVRTADHHSYPLPRSEAELSQELVTHACGPVADFLLRAADLGDFALWAQEVFLGDSRPGWWGGFEPVFPQGTGPLEAAAFAAAASGDTELVEFLTARVENEQVSEHYFDDFLAEIRQMHPQIRRRHPITRPLRG